MPLVKASVLSGSLRLARISISNFFDSRGLEPRVAGANAPPGCAVSWYIKLAPAPDLRQCLAAPSDCDASMGCIRTSTMRCLYFVLFVLFEVAIAPSGWTADSKEFPHFRHFDRLAPKPVFTPAGKLLLLADEDFAPFSFRTIDGNPAGLAIDSARAACEAMNAVCEIKLLPYAGLIPALEQKQGDAVLDGPAVVPRELIGTRPYYLSTGRFLAHAGSSLADIQPKTLAGRQVGFVKGSAQEAFLKKDYSRSSLEGFASEAEMFDALRNGKLELAFADSLHGAFWLKGENAKACCVALGPGLVDRATISRGLSIILRKGDESLRDALDYALDQAQENGSMAKIMATYLPSSPF
jgi:polar amino acid transport system substrate-binding protein